MDNDPKWRLRAQIVPVLACEKRTSVPSGIRYLGLRYAWHGQWVACNYCLFRMILTILSKIMYHCAQSLCGLARIRGALHEARAVAGNIRRDEDKFF